MVNIEVNAMGRSSRTAVVDDVGRDSTAVVPLKGEPSTIHFTTRALNHEHALSEMMVDMNHARIFVLPNSAVAERIPIHARRVGANHDDRMASLVSDVPDLVLPSCVAM